MLTSSTLRPYAQRVTRFATIQFIALVGWILVQSFFSLSPLGRTLPIPLMIVVEAIWWIATLVIMFMLFRREYNSFTQAALDLEDANRRLRETTNKILANLENQSDQEESVFRLDEEHNL